MSDIIVGIDLGTTNSEVAALVDGKVEVLASAGEQIMPSYVGLSPEGRLLVGSAARNQYILYPERTLTSIKRLMGSVLVDISPYFFGSSYLGFRHGIPYEHCYHPIIARHTPLPVSRTDSYFTIVANQEAWRVSIYQGDDPDALNNILVGQFLTEGVSAGSEILCRMDLDLDGILRVTAAEKRTGLAKYITVEGATTALSDDEIAEARRRTAELFGDEDEDDLHADEAVVEGAFTDAGDGREHCVRISEACVLLECSRRLLNKMSAEDREEAIALHKQLEAAMEAWDWDQLRAASTDLADLLFYVEEG